MTQVGTNGDDPETYFNNTDPVIYGLDGDDVIRFTGPSDARGVYIDGGRGNDTIYGGAGIDVVYGGEGDDIIHGGLGPIVSHFGMAGDQLNGGAGNDIIFGEGGQDFIFGDAGHDTLYGGEGTRYLDGGFGNDIIYVGPRGVGDLGLPLSYPGVHGGDGDDLIHGMAGEGGVFFGSLGNDSYEITHGAQQVYEDGAGRDIVYAYVDFTLAAHVEVLDMSYGAQTYGYGNDEDNLIFGNASNNVLEGSRGHDMITGGAGTDLFVINPDWGFDVLTDFVPGGGTEDAVIFSSSVFETYEQVIASARQVGSDTWISDAAGNTVVLLNVAFASLHPDDFGFI